MKCTCKDQTSTKCLLTPANGRKTIIAYSCKVDGHWAVGWENENNRMIAEEVTKISLKTCATVSGQCDR
jgi:hypothetical protein